jgi:TATA-box binding protein (TBP) (component of TFIID and TFIIIB)
MSSAKEERKVQRENEKVIDRTIEETKDNTRKAVQEARKELPEFTAAFHDYQEQNMIAIKDIAYNSLELQKAAAKSSQAIYGTYGKSTLFWPYWIPQAWMEAYTRMASNFADTAIAATRLSNELMLASIETTRNSLDYAKNSTQGLVKLYKETAETAEEMSRDLSGRRAETA